MPQVAQECNPRAFLESTGPQISCNQRSSNSCYSQYYQKWHNATSPRLVSWQLIKCLCIQVVTKNLLHCKGACSRKTLWAQPKHQNSRFFITVMEKKIRPGNVCHWISYLASSMVGPATKKSQWLPPTILVILVNRLLSFWQHHDLAFHPSNFYIV